MSEAVRIRDTPLVVCDANVFYSIVTTDLILSLGVAELIRLRWTAKIARRRQQMDAAIDDCLIAGYEALMPQLQLPDLDDRHVLAAAIHARASVILTYTAIFPAAYSRHTGSVRNTLMTFFSPS